MRSITIKTFPATVVPEADPLLREFSSERKEMLTHLTAHPPRLFSEPGMIQFQAKLGAAARSLLQTVTQEGYLAQSLTLTVDLTPTDAEAEEGPYNPFATTPRRLLHVCKMALFNLTGEGGGDCAASKECLAALLRLAIDCAEREGYDR